MNQQENPTPGPSNDSSNTEVFILTPEVINKLGLSTLSPSVSTTPTQSVSQTTKTVINDDEDQVIQSQEIPSTSCSSDNMNIENDNLKLSLKQRLSSILISPPKLPPIKRPIEHVVCAPVLSIEANKRRRSKIVEAKDCSQSTNEDANLAIDNKNVIKTTETSIATPVITRNKRRPRAVITMITTPVEDVAVNINKQVNQQVSREISVITQDIKNNSVNEVNENLILKPSNQQSTSKFHSKSNDNSDDNEFAASEAKTESEENMKDKKSNDLNLIKDTDVSNVENVQNAEDQSSFMLTELLSSFLRGSDSNLAEPSPERKNSDEEITLENLLNPTPKTSSQTNVITTTIKKEKTENQTAPADKQKTHKHSASKRSNVQTHISENECIKEEESKIETSSKNLKDDVNAENVGDSVNRLQTTDKIHVKRLSEASSVSKKYIDHNSTLTTDTHLKIPSGTCKGEVIKEAQSVTKKRGRPKKQTTDTTIELSERITAPKGVNETSLPNKRERKPRKFFGDDLDSSPSDIEIPASSTRSGSKSHKVDDAHYLTFPNSEITSLEQINSEVPKTRRGRKPKKTSFDDSVTNSSVSVASSYSDVDIDAADVNSETRSETSSSEPMQIKPKRGRKSKNNLQPNSNSSVTIATDDLQQVSSSSVDIKDTIISLKSNTSEKYNKNIKKIDDVAKSDSMAVELNISSVENTSEESDENFKEHAQSHVSEIDSKEISLQRRGRKAVRDLNTETITSDENPSKAKGKSTPKAIKTETIKSKANQSSTKKRTVDLRHATTNEELLNVSFNANDMSIETNSEVKEVKGIEIQKNEEVAGENSNTNVPENSLQVHDISEQTSNKKSPRKRGRKPAIARDVSVEVEVKSEDTPKGRRGRPKSKVVKTEIMSPKQQRVSIERNTDAHSTTNVESSAASFEANDKSVETAELEVMETVKREETPKARRGRKPKVIKAETSTPEMQNDSALKNESLHLSFEQTEDIQNATQENLEVDGGADDVQQSKENVKTKCSDLKSESDDESDQELNLTLSALATSQTNDSNVSADDVETESSASDMKDMPSAGVRGKGRPPRGRGGRGRGKGRGKYNRKVLDATVMAKEHDGEAKDMVKCARCNTQVSPKSWTAHNLRIHNNLSWKEGEPPLNLDDEKFVASILAPLYKQYRRAFRCETCDKTTKSVAGFLSHRAVCGKSQDEIESAFVTCEECGLRVNPFTVYYHMDTHRKAKLAEEARASLQLPSQDETGELGENCSEDPSGRKRRKAAVKAADLLQNIVQEDDEVQTTKTKKMSGRKLFSKNFDFLKINVIPMKKIKKEMIEKGSIKCKHENCTLLFRDLQQYLTHLNDCSTREDAVYTCTVCLYTNSSEEDVIRHCKVDHKKKYDDGSTEDDDEDSNDSEDDEEDVRIKRHVQRASAPRAATDASRYFSGSRVKFLSALQTRNASTIFEPTYDWNLKMHTNFGNINLFPSCHRIKSKWLCVDESSAREFLPVIKKSMKVTRMVVKNVTCVQSMQDFEWRSYNILESNIDDDGTSTVFCGGAVRSMAWAPTPYNRENVDQILAVSCQRDPNHLLFGASCHLSRNVVQFWNFGPISNQSKEYEKPKLEFCLAHHYGLVWAMEWCPSNCFTDTADNENYSTRLGLLALGCSDGNVYVHVVSPSKDLPSSSSKIYTSRPNFVLIMEKKYAFQADSQFHAFRISWTKAPEHKHIAVGYTNGIVALFDLSLSSPLLVLETTGNTITLLPYLSFQAHVGPVSALTLNHLNNGNRWLMTGSFDRRCKFWDLENTTHPIANYRSFLITEGAWFTHWLSCVLAFDESFSTPFHASHWQNVRDLGGKRCTVMYADSDFNSTSLSDWSNAVAHGTGGGEVIGVHLDAILAAVDNNKKQTRQRLKASRFICSYASLIQLNETPEIRAEKHKKKVDAMKNVKIPQPPKKHVRLLDAKLFEDNPHYFEIEPNTYDEVVEKYGLVFCDLPMNSPKDLTEDMQKCLQDSANMQPGIPHLYQVQSVNKVCWNPNKQAFFSLASGYEAGFVKVSHVKLRKTPK